MVVVDGLDEGLNLAAFCLTSFRHTAGDLRGVALDARDKGVREGMCLGTGVQRLEYNDLTA